MISPQSIVHAVPDETVSDLWLKRVDTDSFLSEMRKRGAFKVESIGALRRVANISLREAKERVHFSKAWADTRETDEVLHEEILQALNEGGYDESRQTHLEQLAS